MTDLFGEQIRVKAMSIPLTFDLPARVEVLYQIGHGGRCACSFCYIQGMYLEGNKKYCYPFVESNITADSKLRTIDETFNIY
jgi:DNA repair photolyase